MKFRFNITVDSSSDRLELIETGRNTATYYMAKEL